MAVLLAPNPHTNLNLGHAAYPLAVTGVIAAQQHMGGAGGGYVEGATMAPGGQSPFIGGHDLSGIIPPSAAPAPLMSSLGVSVCVTESEDVSMGVSERFSPPLCPSSILRGNSSLPSVGGMNVMAAHAVSQADVMAAAAEIITVAITKRGGRGGGGGHERSGGGRRVVERGGNDWTAGVTEKEGPRVQKEGEGNGQVSVLEVDNVSLEKGRAAGGHENPLQGAPACQVVSAERPYQSSIRADQALETFIPAVTTPGVTLPFVGSGPGMATRERRGATGREGGGERGRDKGIPDENRWGLPHSLSVTAGSTMTGGSLTTMSRGWAGTHLLPHSQSDTSTVGGRGGRREGWGGRERGGKERGRTDGSVSPGEGDIVGEVRKGEGERREETVAGDEGEEKKRRTVYISDVDKQVSVILLNTEAP